jgi:hypothetical protein
MLKRFNGFLLAVAMATVTLPISLFADVRAMERCARNLPRTFRGGGDCLAGFPCEVGVRGAWLDLTNSVTVRSAPPNASVSIEDKGVEPRAFGCVPSGQGSREGYVRVKLTNISGTGRMTLRLSRPNAFGGTDHDDVSFDVRDGSTFIERPELQAEAGVTRNFTISGRNLDKLRLKLVPVGGSRSFQPRNPDQLRELSQPDAIVSQSTVNVTVRLTYGSTGTFSLEDKLEFEGGEPFLNATQGWPTVRVTNPAPPPPPPGITVSVTGPGTGTVASAPPGISCPNDCNQAFPTNTTVVLTPTASDTSRFNGWTGDCTGLNCQINTATRPTARVTAQFIRVTKLTVNKIGPASAGTVTSGTIRTASGTINCGGTCSTQTIDVADTNASVTLTATQAPGHSFRGWSVAGCSDTSTTCTFTVGSTNRIVDVTFQ